jgi:hypothetical protein
LWKLSTTFPFQSPTANLSARKVMEGERRKKDKEKIRLMSMGVVAHGSALSFIDYLFWHPIFFEHAVFCIMKNYALVTK